MLARSSPKTGRASYQKGLVLFTTMMLTSILTLLVLSLIQAVFLYVKASQQFIHRHQAFYQLEAVANQLRLSNLLDEDFDCFVEGKNPNEVIELLKRHQGCKKMVGKQSYYYLFEDLGEQACFLIESNHNLFSSHHWLLSVVSMESPIEVLQLRFAKSMSLMPCSDHERIISAGILSWRHLMT